MRRIVVWLLVVAFFGGRSFNAIGTRATRDTIARWGYPRWWCRVTGGLEIVVAALLAVPVSRDVGSALGATIIVAAVVTIVRRREFAHMAPLALFWFLPALATG